MIKKIKFTTGFFINSFILVKYCYFWLITFVFSNLNLSITDAFFESMSGITTTGSTIIQDLEIAPKGILLWRAILQCLVVLELLLWL